MPKSARKIAYDLYLRSEHWANLIRLKSTDGGDQCLNCRRYDGLVLHHMIYRDRWEDAKLSDLVWLCSRCHHQFHRKHRAMLPNALELSQAELLRKTKSACQHPKPKPAHTKPTSKNPARAEAKAKSALWRAAFRCHPLDTIVNPKPVFVKRPS